MILRVFLGLDNFCFHVILIMWGTQIVYVTQSGVTTAVALVSSSFRAVQTAVLSTPAKSRRLTIKSVGLHITTTVHHAQSRTDRVTCDAKTQALAFSPLSRLRPLPGSEGMRCLRCCGRCVRELWGLPTVPSKLRPVPRSQGIRGPMKIDCTHRHRGLRNTCSIRRGIDVSHRPHPCRCVCVCVGNFPMIVLQYGSPVWPKWTLSYGGRCPLQGAWWKRSMTLWRTLHMLIFSRTTNTENRLCPVCV